MGTFKFKYCGKEYEGHFVINRYSNNGHLYIGIECLTNDYGFQYWEPFCDVSTNLEDFDFSENYIAIKQYRGGDKIEQILKELGVIKRFLGTVFQGYGEFHVVEVDLNKIKEYC